MSVTLPLVVAFVYLVGLGLLSELADRRPALAALARHPIVYALALGVYATSWTFYGSVGFAARYGYAFLAVSLGVVLACLAIPILWRPVAELVRRHRFTSLADLFAFRYQSELAGALVTLLLVAGLLPYLALQLRAVADAAVFLAGDDAPAELGLVYVALLGLFAVIVGARQSPERARRPGLMLALGLESLLKTIAILVVGALAFGELGGLSGLNARLHRLPDLHAPLAESPWSALVLSAAAAGFLLPRQFHVAFVEQPSRRALRWAIVLVPLLLLLLNLPLPILYWAGLEHAAGLGEAGHALSPDHYVLAASSSDFGRLVAFFGGLSASSAMVLVSTYALSGMVSTHLVLPLRGGATGLSFVRLVRLRRVIVAALVLASFALHLVLRDRPGPARSLVDLGLVSFVAVVQFLPGLVGTLFWARATSRGLLAGLAGGAATWLVATLLPLLGLAEGRTLPELLGMPDEDPRSLATWLSLAVNSLLFVGASLARPSTTHEEAAAAACAAPGVAVGGVATPASVGELRARIVASLGEATADRTMAVALREADVTEDERRPLPLRRLAERVEAELSAWLGPLAARRVLGGDEDVGVGRALEQALAAPTRTPEGEVRRWLLALLEELPMGVCAIDAAGEIVVWNRDVAELTGVDDAIGARVDALPAPFAELFTELRGLPEDVLHERHAKGRVLRLRHATLPEVGGEVLLVEDLTERRELRAQVAHQDRLASLGRLAAGVAHELGNPLAGLLMVAKGLACEPHAEDAAERLGLVVGEAERLDGLLRTLLGFARRGGMDGAIVARDLLADAARIAKLGRDGKHVRWTIDAPDGLLLRGDRTRLTQVLVNLLVNAADASPDGEEVVARASREDDVVRIEILDRGEGIDPTVRERIFEPFVTTKAPGEGTGLGLAVSYGIVQDHGGTLSFAAREGGGTVFRVEVRAVE